MIQTLQHIHARRKKLRGTINVNEHFEAWEESCVPSYCHNNLLAAYVSWWRLFKSVRETRNHLALPGQATQVLDFGSSVGELGLLIPDFNYHFVEENNEAVHQLLSEQPTATRHLLSDLPEDYFDVIFALDSLEHNSDYEQIIEKLGKSLNKSGILVLSGPTESVLYKLGRKLAGYDGHYHETNIYAIENNMRDGFQPLSISSLPMLTPLFRISVWRKTD